MYRTLKILLWTTFLFCFTFSGLVWTKPLTHFDGTDSALTAPAAPKEIKQESTAPTPAAPKPAILFLLGTGLIGLVAISRNKLFH
jgi:hypothetical protein